MFYRFARAILRPIFLLLYNIKVVGMDNLPKDKGFIICANHYSAYDPILIAISLPNKISFMAKNELFKNMFLGFIMRSLEMIPVKRGEADIRSIKMSLKALEQKKVLGIFPEGTRNKTGEVIGEPGVTMLALRAKVPVVPIAVKSTYKYFKRTTIIIGNEREFSEFYNKKLSSEDYKNLSIELMKEVKNLMTR